MKIKCFLEEKDVRDIVERYINTTALKPIDLKPVIKYHDNFGEEPYLEGYEYDAELED